MAPAAEFQGPWKLKGMNRFSQGNRGTNGTLTGSKGTLSYARPVSKQESQNATYPLIPLSIE